jgi:hypothetical protein
MKKQTTFSHFGLVGLALALCLSVGMPRNAQALTMVLDWTGAPFTDIFGNQTGPFDATPWGTIGTSAQIQAAGLAGVIDHYLGYPTNAADAFSPLAAGKELDINFVNGTVGSAASNGDTEYYFIKIGDGISGANASNPGTFGAACGSCVRNAGGAGPNFGVANGATVGVVWPDHMEFLIGTAGFTTATNLMNLIVGTVSHEIGHTLALGHTSPNPAQDANPGASAWGVMGSGATSMPTSQRGLEREFTYANFGTLIGSVGVRDVANVPVPGTLLLMAIGMMLIGRRGRVSKKAA